MILYNLWSNETYNKSSKIPLVFFEDIIACFGEKLRLTFEFPTRLVAANVFANNYNLNLSVVCI